MEERLYDERVSIRDSARALKKYGSTSNRMNRQEEYIKHYVQKGETLQGITLKYGVTMEVVRRANRLFASDSLFLREVLLIPCTKDTPFYGESEIVSEPASRNHRASISELPNAPLSPSSPDEKKSFDDFLNRVDSSLADIKKHVEKTKESSVFAQELEGNSTRHKPIARLRQSASMSGPSVSSISNTAIAAASNFAHNSVPYQQITSEDMPIVQHPTLSPTAPPPVSVTGRRLRNSLQRLERTHDELFQL